jgi:hypothetical protein
MGLLAKPQRVQRGLEGVPIDHRRDCKFIPRLVFSMMTNGLRHFCLHLSWQENVRPDDAVPRARSI